MPENKHTYSKTSLERTRL